MESSKVQDSTMLSLNEYSPYYSPLVPKGILRRIQHKSFMRRSATVRVEPYKKVTFLDSVKNVPISTIFEVDTIKYKKDKKSSKKGSCACILF